MHMHNSRMSHGNSSVTISCVWSTWKYLTGISSWVTVVNALRNSLAKLSNSLSRTYGLVNCPTLVTWKSTWPVPTFGWHQSLSHGGRPVSATFAYHLPLCQRVVWFLCHGKVLAIITPATVPNRCSGWHGNGSRICVDARQGSGRRLCISPTSTLLHNTLQRRGLGGGGCWRRVG